MVPEILQGQVLAVSAGGYHTCLLKTDTTVACFGAAWSGQLAVPKDLAGVVSLSAGRFHSCVAKADGTAACWGSTDVEGVAQLPPSINGFVASVSAGGFMSCAVLVDGSVECWGSTSAAKYLTPPPGLSDVLVVSAGMFHACILKTSPGEPPVCWGDNSWSKQATVPAWS